MKKNNMIMDKLTDTINAKSTEVKQFFLAKKLYKELESKSLEQILKDHLKATSPDLLKTAASDMQRAIREMYDNCGSHLTNAQIEAQLNKILDGYDCCEQGKRLVNLLHCAKAVTPDLFVGPTYLHWEKLKNAETYTAADVAMLLELARIAITHNASFLARREFMVMHNALTHMSVNLAELQMNSGAKYAEAYAAAMYIVSKQSSVTPQEALSPYQMALAAANAVESSTILAKAHLGQMRAEEALEKLEELAKKMLTCVGKLTLHLSAFAVRVGMSCLAADAVLDIMLALSVTNSLLLLVIPFVMFAANFSVFTHEEIVCVLTDIWENIKAAFLSVMPADRHTEQTYTCSYVTV